MKTNKKLIHLKSLITRTASLAFLLLLYSCIQYPEQSESVSTPSTPTLVSSGTTTASNDDSCSSDQVTLYLKDVDSAMKKTNKLALDFGQTQNHEEAEKIVEQVDNLYEEVFLWEIPECAQEVHVSLVHVILKLSNMQHALLDGDMDTFNKDYQIYEIALDQLNSEVKNLEDSVK